MPKKIPLVSVRVQRKGVSVSVPLNTPFDFTDDEIADLERMSKDAGTPYLRDPINETATETSGNSSDDARAKTIEVVRSLVDGENVPSMSAVNEALKAAGLPKITAAERDAFIAELADL